MSNESSGTTSGVKSMSNDNPVMPSKVNMEQRLKLNPSQPFEGAQTHAKCTSYITFQAKCKFFNLLVIYEAQKIL